MALLTGRNSYRGDLTMLIELEPAKPNFSRGWVTGGFDDFIDAVKRFAALHDRCGDGRHVTVSECDCDSHARLLGCSDGVRRVWAYCDCGCKRLILGPPNGGDMKPLFPRMQ